MYYFIITYETLLKLYKNTFLTIPVEFHVTDRRPNSCLLKIGRMVFFFKSLTGLSIKTWTQLVYRYFRKTHLWIRSKKFYWNWLRMQPYYFRIIMHHYLITCFHSINVNVTIMRYDRQIFYCRQTSSRPMTYNYYCTCDSSNQNNYYGSWCGCLFLRKMFN